MIINSPLYQVLKMKNLSGKTLIFYSFQNRKNQQFNVTTFRKSMPQQPKIRDVLFELPINFETKSYHFRFKSQFSQADDKIIGWIDISNLLSKVPMIGTNIYVKILQLPSDNQNKLFTRDKLKSIGLLDPTGNNLHVQANNLPKSKKPAPKSKQPVPNNIQKKDLINKSQNLFEFDTDSKSQPNGKSHQPTVQPTSQNFQRKVIPGGTMEQNLKTYIQGFKTEQKMRQDEKLAAETLDQKIIEWGYCGKKTLNNPTTLLATLHTLWPQWKPVSLSDMLKPEDVQSKFKTAKFMLHPDKNRNKDPQTKYLAKRLFQLLNDSKNAQK